MPQPPDLLGRAQRLGGREAGGPHRGIQSGDSADDEGGAQTAVEGHGGDLHRPVLAHRVDDGRHRADDGAGQAAEDRQEHGLGQELLGDVAPGGTQGPTQADLGAALQDRDDHDVGDADAADEEGHGAETEEQYVIDPLGGHLGLQDVRRIADRHDVGVGRVGGDGQDGRHGVDLAGNAAQVEPGGVAVEAEVLLGDGESDEGHAVHLGEQYDGVQDADHREPVSADQHLRRVRQIVDAEQAGRLGAQDDRRVPGRSRVEEGAVGQGGTQGGGQGGVGRGQRNTAGVTGRNKGVAVDVDVRDAADLGHAGDRSDARHHANGGGGQLGLLPEGGALGLHGEEVAELAQLAEQAGLGGLGDAEHADDGGDAEADA